jgi:uncharacterized phage protein (TIGR01671 family)
MRDIKFRGKNSDTGEWVYGHYTKFMRDGEIFDTIVVEVERGLDVYRIGDTFTIGQYTGLQDKNGVEIYEGDIVQFTYWWFYGNECESTLTGTIVYSDPSMSFQLKGVKNKEWERHTGCEGDTEYLTPFSELNFCDADFTVIGNIHENPELLQREAERLAKKGGEE